MLKNIGQFTVIIAIAVVLSAVSFAQLSESQARELIVASECVKTLETDPRFVRIVRNEELEDEIFELQKKPRGDVIKKTMVFEATSAGYFVTSPDTVVVKTSPGISRPLLAVSVVASEVFPLYGCQNAEENFAKLIGKTDVRVVSILEAEKFALLRYTFVKDPRRDRWITHPRQLKHEAENFFATHVAGDEESSFKRWLKIFNKVQAGLTLGVRATDDGTGYTAMVTYMTTSRKLEFHLIEEHISLSRNGEYEKRRSITVF